jgi:hypothetical protein
LDSRQELIDSLSEDEVREVLVELNELRDRAPLPSTILSRIFEQLGPEGLREALDSLENERPDIDLAALVQRVREKE